MNQLDENKRRKINQKILDAAGSRFVPPRTSFSPEEAKTLFYPPITLNTKEPEKEESRFTNDAAIGSSFNAYYASLTQHALDLGQFPMTSFVGYGVLQNIAQNGMIRTCIQTVADDMCREWIQVEGGEDESADNVKKLQELQDNTDRLRRLVKEGMDIARFNFSHGSHEEQKGRMDMLKKIREEEKKPVAILLDTKGPEIRTGVLKDGKKVLLKEGETITLTNEEIEGDETKVSLTYKGLVDDVQIGNMILIDDGLVGLEVVEINHQGEWVNITARKN